MHYDRERLEERALRVCHVIGELVAPLCRVHFVALDSAVIGIDAGELDVLAQVVSAVLAEKA